MEHVHAGPEPDTDDDPPDRLALRPQNSPVNPAGVRNRP